MDIGFKRFWSLRHWPIYLIIMLIIPVALAQKPQESQREFELLLSPQRCISLHKGQTCFQEVRVSWRTPLMGRYCLLINTQEAPLRCWHGNEVIELDYVFEGTESLSFQIKSQQDGAVVASRLFEVSWVYRSSRSKNSTWRLF